jgi:hypothetical protein
VRVLLVALLTLALAPAADAYWPDPQIVSGAPAVDAHGGIAADGTPVIAWEDSRGAWVRIGSGAPVNVDNGTFPSKPNVTVSGDQVVVIMGGGPPARSQTSFTTKVMSGTVSAGLTQTIVLNGVIGDVAANRTGDVALLLRHNNELVTDLYWRPAGGSFGAAVATPLGYYGSLAVSPIGEVLVAWIDEQGSPKVASSTQGGPFGPPVTLPVNSVGGPLVTPEVAMDAHGRALAAFIANPQSSTYPVFTHPSLAVRDGGTWRSVPDVPQDLRAPMQVRTGDDGQAMLGWQNRGFRVIDVSLAAGTITGQTVVAMPFLYGFSGSEPDAHGTHESPTLTVAADGSSSLVWGQDRKVVVAKRSGVGSFGESEIAGCQFLFLSSPITLGMDGSNRVGVLHDAYPGGGLALAREEPGAGAARTCPEAEPGSLMTFRPSLTSTPARVMVGDQARLTIAARAPNAQTVSDIRWLVDGTDTGATGEDVTLTFGRPGARSIGVTTVQHYEQLGAKSIPLAVENLNVYAPATLTAKPRQHQRLRLRASALTYGPEVQATLVIRRKGRIRRRITGSLGLARKRLDLPAKTRGIYRIELRQDGVVQAKVKVRVT